MTIRIDFEGRLIRLSVRDLAETTAQERFSSVPGSPYARYAQGQTLHTELQEILLAEHPGFQKEVSVKAEFSHLGYKLIVSGRIDGLYSPSDEPDSPGVVEEIKSVSSTPPRWEELPGSLRLSYATQVRLYAYLLSLQHPDTRFVCRLLLVSIHDRSTTLVDIPFESERVGAELSLRMEALVAEAESRRIHHERRREIGEGLTFPYPEVRPHQKEAMEIVTEALHGKAHLLLEAPPGIGKTAAALYPAIKHALSTGKKVYFATAKTTQARMVLDTVSRFMEKGSFMKTVFLRAKAKMCANTEIICHEEYCRYAANYSGKMMTSNLLASLCEVGTLSSDRIYDASVAAEVCPFEVSLDLIDEADVVVGDYNYVFDPRVYLHDYFRDPPYDDWVLVVDEAHNLHPRGAGYYSPELSRDRVADVRKECSLRGEEVFHHAMLVLSDTDRLFERDPDQETVCFSGKACLIEPDVLRFRDLRGEVECLLTDYLSYRRDRDIVGGDDPLLLFLYDLLYFTYVISLTGPEFSTIHFFQAEDQEERIKILCKDPSRFLSRRLDGFHATILMSATLRPMEFHQRLLGLSDDRTLSVSLPSPFPPENRKVFVVPQVSTRYRDRDGSYDPIAQLLHEVTAVHPGNYLAFFPSHAYLHRVRELIPMEGPDLLVQTRKMSEDQREDFLATLATPPSPRGRLVLGVQGGIFSEGIDYVGDLCIGVFVVSPALPRYDLERELIRSHFQERYERGFEYAYVYPGMSRVIQAAGRLIRADTDRGVVLLIGDRFATPTYCSLFPRDWYSEAVEELIEKYPIAAVREFFKGKDPDPVEAAEPGDQSLLF